jgi:hypothetical protein
MKLLSIIDSFVKLRMLYAVGRFGTMVKSESHQDYYRSEVRILDKLQNLVYEGMAEADSIYIARLKAFAETYERLCFYQYYPF